MSQTLTRKQSLILSLNKMLKVIHEYEFSNLTFRNTNLNNYTVRILHFQGLYDDDNYRVEFEYRLKKDGDDSNDYFKVFHNIESCVDYIRLLASVGVTNKEIENLDSEHVNHMAVENEKYLLDLV